MAPERTTWRLLRRDALPGTITITGPVAQFLLHLAGEEAWFRWSDEPFDA